MMPSQLLHSFVLILSVALTSTDEQDQQNFDSVMARRHKVLLSVKPLTPASVPRASVVAVPVAPVVPVALASKVLLSVKPLTPAPVALASVVAVPVAPVVPVALAPVVSTPAAPAPVVRIPVAPAPVVRAAASIERGPPSQVPTVEELSRFPAPPAIRPFEELRTDKERLEFRDFMEKLALQARRTLAINKLRDQQIRQT
uniref:Uncharacterized protein n=1 Tax=Plectus sambesii TaxID=2011161 RepID=A0A914WHG9_9BILA